MCRKAHPYKFMTRYSWAAFGDGGLATIMDTKVSATSRACPPPVPQVALHVPLHRHRNTDPKNRAGKLENPPESPRETTKNHENPPKFRDPVST